MKFSTNRIITEVAEGTQVHRGTAVCDLKGERAFAMAAGVAVSAIADGSEAVAISMGSRAIARGLGARAVADGQDTVASAYGVGAIAIGINGGTAKAFDGATIWEGSQMIDKANAEQYITAEQARELGVGNAEYFDENRKWSICGTHCAFYSGYRYCAIKQAQPEPSDPHAALRAEYIRQRDAMPCELVFYLWEYAPIKIDSWQPCKDFTFSMYWQYRYTDISCMVAKQGEPAKRMLRTEAQELQRNLGDTVEWYLGEVNMAAYTKLDFDSTDTYTYAPKALKQVSWSDMPVEVMTNKGELICGYIPADKEIIAAAVNAYMGAKK